MAHLLKLRAARQFREVEGSDFQHRLKEQLAKLSLSIASDGKTSRNTSR